MYYDEEEGSEVEFLDGESIAGEDVDSVVASIKNKELIESRTTSKHS
jgi:hypothetical protein